MAAVLLLLAALAAPSYPLLCYQCNSYFDAQCGDAFTNDHGAVRSGEEYLKECTSGFGEQVFCRSEC